MKNLRFYETAKLLQIDGWVRGTGELLEDFLIITYDGKRYYRDVERIGGEDDIVFKDQHDPSEPKEIFVKI